MKIRYILILAIMLLLTVQISYAYSISTSGRTITVKMEHPTQGLTHLNSISWSDNPDQIGRDIYELFVGPFDQFKTGTYTVVVYWKTKDKYGNKDIIKAGSYTFDADELRKYKSYSYSKDYRNVSELLYKMAFGETGNKQRRIIFGL